MSVCLRNDATTLRALANLYVLARHHGGDLEHAAIKHLAADLGYDLRELDAVRGGPEQPPAMVPSTPPVTQKAAVAGGGEDSA